MVLQRGQTLSDTPPSQTPVQVSKVVEQDLSRLMDIQVDLADQVYSYQLDSALHSKRQAGGGARQIEGFWTLPIEEVLPAPAHIPESFRGKTWAQIEQEDEEKVDKLVQQFRQQRFICYFDSESLARYYLHLYCYRQYIIDRLNTNTHTAVNRCGNTCCNTWTDIQAHSVTH